MTNFCQFKGGGGENIKKKFEIFFGTKINK
jgi:hypothetical protein